MGAQEIAIDSAPASQRAYIVNQQCLLVFRLISSRTQCRSRACQKFPETGFTHPHKGSKYPRTLQLGSFPFLIQPQSF